MHGLPFRGAEEKFGSNNSGNYIISLELITKFDPFLAEHIKRYVKKEVDNIVFVITNL